MHLRVFVKYFQLPLYFFHFSQKSQIQNIILFFFSTFYITLIIFFITTQIKKTHYKIKHFYFFINQFQTFIYFISHQSLFTTIQTFYYKNSTITLSFRFFFLFLFLALPNKEHISILFASPT
jgi:hypothetical protein